MSAGPEDDLLQAVTDALYLRTGFNPDDVWQHVRRSDRAQVMGSPGFPDIVGVVGDTLIAWELKSPTGRLMPHQFRWAQALDAIKHVDVRTVRPADLDGVVSSLLGDRLTGRARRIAP